MQGTGFETGALSWVRAHDHRLLNQRGTQALENQSAQTLMKHQRMMSQQAMQTKNQIISAECPVNLPMVTSTDLEPRSNKRSVKNRTPVRLRKIDLARSTMFEDNNKNVELYRSQIGDQKFSYRNRYNNLGGPSSKKMSYQSNLANRAVKIAALGIDPQKYIESALTPTFKPDKIIFGGQEIDNKELDFEKCSKYYNIRESFQNVEKDIEMCIVKSEAMQLKQLPIFKNV